MARDRKAKTASQAKRDKQLKLTQTKFSQKSPFRTATLWLIWGWLLIFALLPNLLVIAVSFLTRDSTAFISLPVSIDSYVRMMDPLYFEVFMHSLWMAGITTVICLLLGYPFAWLVSKTNGRWQALLMMLLILPFWTNSLVRTYALKLLFANNGLINKLLLGIGIIDTPINILYTQGAVIAGLTYLLFPFMVLPLYAVFTDLREDMLLASQDLGASKAQTFWHVVLPLTTPGIISGVLLVLLPAMGMFYVADILGGSRNLLVGNIIKNQFLDARDWPFGAAASVLLTLAMAVLLLAYRASSKRIGKTDFNEVA